MRFFIAAVAAAFLVVFLQMIIYRKHGFDHLEYNAKFSTDEACAGDDVYLYEEISNTGRLPLPYIKISTDLPKGLEFVLLESEKLNPEPAAPKKGMKLSTALTGSEKPASKGVRKVKKVQNMQSLFVLKPRARIRRRWRVYCVKRGVYTLSGVMVTGNDILGLHVSSKFMDAGKSGRKTLTVLPAPISLNGNFASSRYLSGDAITNICPVTDPTRICGSREYDTSDPMNRINWKSTAVHGGLMTNIEEKTVRHRFSVLLNMNSKEIEYDPTHPSDENAIERCIVICAGILDRIAAEDLPIKLFVNSDPLKINGAGAVSNDETGGKISVTGPFSGRRDTVRALRMLAELEMSISLPAEKMFDHIAQNPSLYSENENLIVITSYLDGRVINLSEALKPYGVRVVYYVSTARNTMLSIPENLEVYYSIH